MTKRVWIFLGFTFGLAWALWIGIYLLGWSDQLGLSQLLVVGMYAPAMAVLITKALTGKAPILLTSLKPRFKGNILWYFVALVLPLILAILGAFLYFTIYPTHLDMTMGYMRAIYEQTLPGFEVTAEILMMALVTQAISAFTIGPLIGTVQAIGEEIGWRGFLFPTLAARFSPLKVHLLLGLIWGVWYTPLIAMGQNYGFGYPGYPWLGVIAMVVVYFAYSVIFSWLVGKTGSVWVAALAHGSMAASSALATMFVNINADINLVVGPYAMGLIPAIPALVLAAILLLTQKKQPQQPGVPDAGAEAAIQEPATQTSGEA